MKKFYSAGVIFSLLFFGMPSFTSPAGITSAAFSRAQTQSSAQAASTCNTPYTVQFGDTLTGIAQKCNVDFNTLLGANAGITNPDLIVVGQSIQIPGGSSVPVTGTGTGVKTYTVVAGDDLFSIAQRNNTTVQAILNANTWINDQNQIFPGWVITLPPGSTGSSPGIPTTGGQSYTVVPGDTLSGIAQRFNTTTGALMTANPWISNPDLIDAGWIISIP